MFTALVAATDFSADADLALARALRLAPATASGTVTALHVVEAGPLQVLRSLVGEPGAADRLAREDAGRRLAAALAQLAEPGAAAVRAELRSGRLVEELLDAAGPGDLLVVGARGHHGLHRSLLGSTAGRLARAGRAVLVVRRPATAPYRQVLAAVDFSPATAQVLGAARWAGGGPVLAVHAVEFPLGLAMAQAGIGQEAIERHRRRTLDEAATALAAAVAASGEAGHVACDVVEGYPVTALAGRLGSSGADLLVVGRRGASRTDELLLGSVSQHLLAEAECDVLVIP